jgi:hypothetical protein
VQPRGVEAVDELRERRGFERSDRTGEPGKIGDQEHDALASRPPAVMSPATWRTSSVAYLAAAG